MLSATVGDAMTTRFEPLSSLEPLRGFAVTREETLERARERMAEAKAGALPVIEDGEIVGALTGNAIRRYFELEDELGVPLARLIDEISPNDLMFGGSRLAYFMTGASALRCIRRALARAGTPEVSRILDFACGHGRVHRMLKAAFPDAATTACDLDHDAVEFCARTFGAEAVFSNRSIREVELPGKYDLIWCGSLLTHVDEGDWIDTLTVFASHLADGGTAVFSVHGPAGAKGLRDGSFTYELSADRIATVLEGYDERGFGYVDYADQVGYGIAVCSPAWAGRLIERLPGLTEVAYEEGAWARLQDVVVCTREASGQPPR